MQTETTYCLERQTGPGEWDYTEYELTIRGDVEPYVPAKLSGHPDTWEPPEGGGRCIEGIFIEVDGVEKRWTGTLTKKETEEVEEALFEQFKDNCEPDYDGPDSGYDDYRDGNDEWMDYIP